MDLQQEKYWQMLEFIDEAGTGLEREEIDFVANLIDNNRRGKLTLSDGVEIRRLLVARAGGWRAFNNYRDNLTLRRYTAE